MQYLDYTGSYCSVQEFAAQLGVTEARVRRAIAHGDLRAVQLTRNAAYRIPWSEIRRLMWERDPQAALEPER